MPKQLHDRLLARLRIITSTLEGKIKAEEPNRTGKLRSETTSAVYDDWPKKVSGRVFVDGEYAKAGALEYGAHGHAKVGEHAARLDHVWGKKLGSPTVVMVSAHSRQMNIMARKFLRGPLADFGADAIAQLREEVEQTAGQTS